jgi:hypothetical protein
MTMVSKPDNKFYPFVLFGIITCILPGCINTYHKAELKTLDSTSGQPVELVTQATKIGTYVKIYEVPVKITRLPAKPRLVLDFTVADKGHCLVTYEPTQVFVNNKKIASIDFRDFDYMAHQVIDIPVPVENLKTGQNMIRIHTGECQYDIDVMKFNSFKLFQR